jgi:hypothetical protein
MTKPDAAGARRAPRERILRDHPTSDAWLRFLAAERAGRDEEAEAALAALFAAVPSPSPRPGFAGRVMARIAPRSVFAHPGSRFGVAAALALAALSAALLAPMLLPLAGLVSLADLIGGGSRLLAAVAVRVASVLAGWESVGQVVAAVGRALLAPETLPFVLAQFAVAALALRALVRIARLQRSSNHAVLR